MPTLSPSLSLSFSLSRSARLRKGKRQQHLHPLAAAAATPSSIININCYNCRSRTIPEAGSIPPFPCYPLSRDQACSTQDVTASQTVTAASGSLLQACLDPQPLLEIQANLVYINFNKSS